MNSDSPQFQQAFQNLNPAQKKAVETIYGPVLVVAGPGTGKTQVLALRIAHILQTTDTSPGNVLALTFTESGAVEMRKRLLEFIGPTAHSVHIATFHSFCQDLISEFPEKFLFARRLESIDDLTRIQILKNILENSDLTFLRPFKNPNFFLKEIQGLISSLKREGVSPLEFSRICEQERKEFDAIPESEKMNPKTGKMKGKYTQQETRISKYLELQKVYAAYQEQMTEQGLYDFEDMIRFVVDKMEGDEDFLWTLRERYLFVLTDEFQDTNGVQMKLLELFAGTDEAPNIFAVGDDDQSIYRFQGASLENILYFRKHFPQSEIICLTENYRSTQNILDLSQSIIEHNEERLTKKIEGLEKNLKAADPRKDRSQPVPTPEIHVFPREENEHFFLAEKIRELHDRENIPYSAIAVLVRNNSEGFELLRFFEQQDIPVAFSGRGNALKSPIVRQMLKLLRLIRDPQDDALFFECLHYSFFDIPVATIWNLWEQVQKEVEGQGGKFWKFWCSHTLRRVTPENTEAQKFQIFSEHLARWQQDLQNLSLPELFQKVITESGLLEFLAKSPINANFQPDQMKNSHSGYSTPTARNLENLNHINAFFTEIKRFSAGNRVAGLEKFLETIELREEFDLPLPERDIHITADNVRLLTAHKAKGLEFSVVFIVHAVSGRWGGQRNRSRITLPDGILRYSRSHEENEDERRLFFVACTRAGERLFFTRSEADAQGREKAESRFLSEISPNLVQTFETEEVTGKSAFDIAKGQLFWNKNRKSRFPEEFLRQAVAPENFALSHSAFESFRENPQKFLWEHILRIPQVKHPSAVLGTALHRALEEFSRHLPQEDTEAARQVFQESLKREVLTETEFTDLEREGETILQNYFREYSGGFMPAFKTEFNFRSHRIFLDGQIPLTGKVDKIEWIDQAAKVVKVIDYKATVPKSENEIRGIRDSDAGKITAGRYFRQLVFYSLLCDLSPKFPERAEVFTIDFLVPNVSGAFKRVEFPVTEEEKTALKEEIRLVWNKIQNLDFTPVNLWGDAVEEDIFGFLEMTQ